MNKPDVKELLDRLHRVTGFRLSIHDGNGREIAASPEHPHAFCQCLQQNPRAKRQCLESDRDAFQRASERGELTVYRCPFGLYEAVYPLYRYGAPAGFLMMGQVPEAGLDVESILHRATPHGNPDAMRQALNQLPEYPRDKIEDFAQILAIFAEYMTLTGAIRAPAVDTIAAVREYLTTHYAKPITIASLCARFALSRTSLLNRYRDRYGEPVGKTLTRVRMTQAHSLLTETSLPITDVAARCGYADPGYFAKAYRSFFGVTPAQARKPFS